jgi:hypothetical protein
LEKEQEKWAIFWCDLLSPVIYDEIQAELINRFLKELTQKKLRFPDGRIGYPALSTLRRKLNIGYFCLRCGCVWYFQPHCTQSVLKYWKNWKPYWYKYAGNPDDSEDRYQLLNLNSWHLSKP